MPVGPGIVVRLQPHHVVVRESGRGLLIERVPSRVFFRPFVICSGSSRLDSARCLKHFESVDIAPTPCAKMRPGSALSATSMNIWSLNSETRRLKGSVPNPNTGSTASMDR